MLTDRTLVAALDRVVATRSEAPFLRWSGGEISFGEFDARSNACARGLAKLGVARGSHVAIMLGNGPEFVTLMFAVAKLGAVYVPINTEYRGNILAHQLALADVTHIAIDVAWSDRLRDVAASVPLLSHVVVVGGECTGEDQFAVTAYCAVLAEPGTRPDVAVAYTDPLAISFTSGTTGPSKGVLATHCHVLSFAIDWIEACGVVPGDRLYSCLPMFHAIATWLGVIPAVLTGNAFAFAPRFSASRFWDDVREFDATVVHGIFAMVPILLKQPPSAADAAVPARIFYIGQRNPEFERRFACRIVEVYGSTETGIVTYTPLSEPQRPGSCGRPNSRTYDVALVDDLDNFVPAGTAGEIVVRPRQPFAMIRDYYNMPSETLAAFRNLWFHTGDNAKADADGYLYFVDRKKDAIRRRGENISSFELESVLNADPRILECAAVAHPSELGEDEVRMVIVTQPGARLTCDDVWTICDERMPRFWVPRFIEFRAELPKTPNGKVQKYLLREVDVGTELHDRMSTREWAA